MSYPISMPGRFVYAAAIYRWLEFWAILDKKLLNVDLTASKPMVVFGL